MPDVEQVRQHKEKIISTMKLSGPALPVQLARTLGVEPIFASAFLSELKAEQRINISNMKVGSSPLYYLSGQENLLEKFIQYLNKREQEAFILLKKEKILEDSTQTPVIRVALRSLKDFANPVTVRINQEPRLFWKYFLLEESQIKPLIEKTLTPQSIPIPQPQQTPQTNKPEQTPQTNKPEQQTQVKIPQQTTQTNKPEQPALLAKPPIPQQTQQASPQIKEPQQTLSPIENPVEIKKIKKVPQKKHEFPEKIKAYLEAKDIEILSILEEKKKEMTARIRIDSLFGKQEYLLLAKDKKTTTENDITVAIHKSQEHKMPSLIISPGELNKKAKSQIAEWKNLLKFEHFKF